MTEPSVLGPDDPKCQRVVQLSRHLEACLCSITPDSDGLNIFDLLRLHPSNTVFSDWFGVDGTRLTRNRISHFKEHHPPIPEVEVDRSTSILEKALREILPRCPKPVRDRIGKSLPPEEPAEAQASIPNFAVPETAPEATEASSDKGACIPPESVPAEPIDKFELIPKPAPDQPRRPVIWYGLAGVFLLMAIVIYAVESRSTPHQAQAAPVSATPVAKSQAERSVMVEPTHSASLPGLVGSPQIEAKPVDNEAKLKPLVNTNLSISTTLPNLAVIIDSADSVSGFSVPDSLRSFLNDGKVQLVGNLADVTSLKAAGLFDALYAGDAQLLRQAIRLSGVSSVLLGKATYSFRRQSELAPDLMTGDLTLTCKLVDRNGTIIRTASIATTGAGFTQSQALERATENAARQVREVVFDSIR